MADEAVITSKSYKIKAPTFVDFPFNTKTSIFTIKITYHVWTI